MATDDAGAGGAGGLDAEFGADDAGGDADLEAALDEPAEGGDEGGGEEDVLLAEPGKRDVDEKTGKTTKTDFMGRPKTTTPKSKGKWYIPTEWDGRKDQKKKSYKSLYADEVGRSTDRNVVGAGHQALLRLGKGVFTENESNYNTEESDLLRLNHDLKMLIEKMESKKDEVQT